MCRIGNAQILVSCLIVCLISTSFSQSTNQTQLTLNNLSTISNLKSGLTYYSVNLSINKDSGKILMITVSAQNQQYIGIYTSLKYDGVDEYFQYPNSDNNTNFCSYQALDTCALELPIFQLETNVTLFFAVEVFQTNSITIMIVLENYYPAKINHNYKVDFTQYQSGVITLTGDQINQYQQVIVQMQYSQFQNIGRFSLYAGIGQLPSNFNSRLESKMMGAFTQILLLEPVDDNTTIYIILQGQKGTKFDISLKAFSPSSPKLTLNETLFYYSSQQTTFLTSIAYNNTIDPLPLFLDFSALGGYGQFQINYCDSLTNFSFASLNGQNGQLVIPSQERIACYQNIKQNGALMIQNIEVKITSIAWYFSYSIALNQGTYPLIIMPYNQKMGTLLQQQDARMYTITGFINESFVLKYKNDGQQKLIFTLYECKSGMFNHQKCKVLVDSSNNGSTDSLTPSLSDLTFTALQSKSYHISISHSSTPSTTSYILLLLPLNPHQYPLTPSHPIISIIQENQYQYYVVNITEIQQQNNITIENGTKLMINLVETNGQSLLLTSLKQQRPNYDMIFKPDTDVQYLWTGKKDYTYQKDSFEAIYIGILGGTQGLYHLQVSLTTSQDMPSRYTGLLSDKLLSFSLSKQNPSVLLSYTAHSIPYTIIFSPTPSCIQYSFSLPITSECSEIPYELGQKVIYMKISHDTLDKEFKFSMYIYSGSHYLFEMTPVMIACIGQCYQFVHVYVQNQIKVVHKGMGYISIKDTNQSYANTKMNITCEKTYPCFVTINASLPFGGQMQVFYDSLQAQQIQWITKPLTFDSSYDYKYFYMPIRSYFSLNTAIFYTEGVSVSVYYNIYAIRENATNAIQYGFPNGFQYMKKSEGNPLRRFHIVEFDSQLIEELGCKDQNQLCIATLAVVPNTSVDYSNQYIQSSIGYFSSNTFRYYIPLNYGYQLSQQYSLIYFTHQLDPQIPLSNSYHIKVQPLSSCRPQIFAPFSNNQQMPFYGQYVVESKNIKDMMINFSISTDTPCQFMVWLIDSQVSPVIPNLSYQFQSDHQGNVVFVFSDKYMWDNKTFTINFDTKMTQIMINVYNKTQSGQINYPSYSSNLGYSSQSSLLTYKSLSQFSNLYLIKARTNTNSRVSLIIHASQSNSIILTNQQTSQQFSQTKSTISYLYYSNNDFLMFVTTDSGYVRLKVTDFKRDDRNVLQIDLNQNSSPWLQVKAINNDIHQYLITIENVLLTNPKRNLQDASYPIVKLHIQESGTIGLPQLYQGVALFDAFYQQDGQNCYKYLTQPIVGRHQLNIDLIFGSKFLHNLPQISYRVSIQTQQSLNSKLINLPTGYRIQTQFYGNQLYQFCFSLSHQPKLVSQQYYIMIQNAGYSLRHLTLDNPISSMNPSLYEIFQYVATQDQYLMVQVVNCQGKNTLLGAKLYSDIYLGQVSELESYYNDGTTIIAKTNVTLGYYYFGVKLNNYDDRYKIRVQLLKENQKIHYDKFQLKQKQITKAKAVQQNGKKALQVELPQVSFLSSANNVKVQTIKYYLFLDNVHQPQQYKSNVLAKCPSLATRSMSSFSITKNLLQPQRQESSATPLTIEIPIDQVPQLFNLTGYVQISIYSPQPQTLTYYYESTSFKFRNMHDNNSGMFSTFVVLFMLFATGGIIFITYRRWKASKEQAKIAFQMATYNHQETNDKPNIQESPNRSIRKALNSNVGYGEFVDQSM